jgi:hypothetical protein
MKLLEEAWNRIDEFTGTCAKGEKGLQSEGESGGEQRPNG